MGETAATDGGLALVSCATAGPTTEGSVTGSTASAGAGTAKAAPDAGVAAGGPSFTVVR